MSLETCWAPLPRCASRILTVGGAGRRERENRIGDKCIGCGEREWWLDGSGRGQEMGPYLGYF